MEGKKLEEEEYDRNRRKSKAISFGRKLSTLGIYAEEDSSIDMSGLTSVSDSADANDASDKSKINVSFSRH